MAWDIYESLVYEYSHLVRHFCHKMSIEFIKIYLIDNFSPSLNTSLNKTNLAASMEKKNSSHQYCYTSTERS